jgi:hypothetical protein
VRIIRVLGSMTRAEEVLACDPATRLVRPIDTPLTSHTEDDGEQEPEPLSGRSPAIHGNQVRFASVHHRVVKVITRTVRRRFER